MAFWNNKLVWVTGASSGIGEAIARQLAERGAILILSSRREESLNSLKLQLPFSDRHHVLPLDVGQPGDLRNQLQTHYLLLEKCDVLIANAGISQRAFTWDATLESERMLMETNFFGVITVTKAVLPKMLAKGRGHIVVMSSVTGKFGFPLRSGYAASKHALHGYFESLRAELKSGTVGVTMVCPGRIRTNISMNALAADGTPHNQMDDGQTNGIPVDVCARKILQAVESNKAEIYIGKERFLVYLNRWFPGLFRIIARSIKPT